jgi:hypothetical protein
MLNPMLSSATHRPVGTAPLCAAERTAKAGVVTRRAPTTGGDRRPQGRGHGSAGVLPSGHAVAATTSTAGDATVGCGLVHGADRVEVQAVRDAYAGHSIVIVLISGDRRYSLSFRSLSDRILHEADEVGDLPAHGPGRSHQQENDARPQSLAVRPPGVRIVTQLQGSSGHLIMLVAPQHVVCRVALDVHDAVGHPLTCQGFPAGSEVVHQHS